MKIAGGRALEIDIGFRKAGTGEMENAACDAVWRYDGSVIASRFFS